jgi:ParB family chromosome partitioning protein
MSTSQLGGFLAIPLTDIHPSPENPRDVLYDVEALAASIKEHGLIQPLIVQHCDEGWSIIAGHRRHAAVTLLGWSNVPCIARKPMLADEVLCTMLVENGQRANLDPIEEARAMRRLIDNGLDVAAVARKVGRSVATINGRLMLLDLPDREQQELRSGHFSLTYASGLVRAAKKAQREKANPAGRQVGRPKGASTKPYFGDTHPLARAVRAQCDHRGSPKVNGVGCGPCWETAIREDATAGQAVAS